MSCCRRWRPRRARWPAAASNLLARSGETGTTQTSTAGQRNRATVRGKQEEHARQRAVAAIDRQQIATQAVAGARLA